MTLDVTDPEPLPANHPLWKFNNVIITPHIAGRSDQDNARMLGTIKENIQRFADGRPLDYLVTDRVLDEIRASGLYRSAGQVST